MYSIEQVQRLQLDEEYLGLEEDKYCLVSLFGRKLTYADVENQCNFAILQIIRALENNYIDGATANTLINTLETYEFSKDMLGVENTINKINKEIIEGYLRIPYFNSLCIKCDDLYDYVRGANY